MRRALTFAVVVLSALACERELLLDGGVMGRDAGSEPPPPRPCLEVSPNELDFGEVESPLNAFKRVELINRTSRQLLVHALPRSNSPFSISPLDAVDLQLPARSQRTVEVQFATSDARLHLDSIELTAGEDCGATISVRGLGSGTVSVEPTFLDFGFVTPGQSKSLELRVINTRRAAVPVTSVQLLANSIPGPAYAGTFPSVPFELPPLSTSTFVITATPPLDLTFDGQLVLSTPFGLALAALRVTGGGPVAQLTPNDIDFPLATFEPSLRGSPSFVSRTVLLRNVSTLGNSPFASLMLVPPLVRIEQTDGGAADEVSIKLAPEVVQGSGLARGVTAPLSVLVTPIAAGPRSYRVTLFTNDPMQPEHVLELRVNALTLGRCSLRVEPPESLALEPTPNGRSRGTVSLINEGPHRCVVDDLDFTLPGFVIEETTDRQLVVEPGTTRTLTIDGPRGTFSFDGALGFHVLGPDSERQFILLRVPP